MTEGTTDVVLVGSGIAATTLAFFLTKWGRRVAMFEAGPAYEYPHTKQYTDEILHLYRDPRHMIAHDLRRLEVTGNYLDSEQLTYEQIMVVGGMATRWSAWTPRYTVEDFATHRHFGYGTDWPVSYAELEPYYGRAEEHLGVSGTDDDNPFAPPRSRPHPLPRFEAGYESQLFMDRLKHKGIVVHSVPQARTSKPFDGRPGCANMGVCGVCPIGARYSPNHHLQRALETGRLSLQANAAVRRVMARADGRVTGVAYYENNRRATEHGARAVVVAAGGIESARLLLLSAAEGGGAARMNQSGHVGQHLMFNHIWTTDARLPEPLLLGRAGAPTAQSHQYVNTPGRKKHGGLKIDFMNTLIGFERDVSGRGGNYWQQGPSPVSEDWMTPADVAAEVGINRGLIRLGVHAETIPSSEKHVQLSAAKDRFGDPVAKVHHQSCAFDEEARLFAEQVGKDIAEKLDGTDIHHSRFFGSGHHHLGTCRMGRDPGKAVVDPEGRVHGVPNLWVAGGSTFPGSSAMNPTLTIVALTIRMAERIHAQLG